MSLAKINKRTLVDILKAIDVIIERVEVLRAKVYQEDMLIKAELLEVRRLANGLAKEKAEVKADVKRRRKAIHPLPEGVMLARVSDEKERAKIREQLEGTTP